MYATNGNVCGKQRVNNPERRAKQCDIFNQNAFALVQVNHLGTQAVSRTELALVHGHTIFCILKQTGTGSLILGNTTRLHTKATVSTPRPPSVVRTATINSSLTSNGNVLGLIGINQRAEVPAIQSFPTCRNNGIELGLESKLKHSTFLDNEIDATFQLNGCSEEMLTCRHDNTPTALLRTLVNSLLNSLLILGSRVGRLSAKFCNVVLFVRKLRHADALLNLLVLLLVPTLSLNAQYHQKQHCNL